MSMTRSRTANETFSRTSAREVASKVAADLHRIQLGYGAPSDATIADYEAELVELLAGGYVDRVTYGFQRSGKWIPPTLEYEARLDGTLITDDRAGKIPRGCDVSGAHFTSYLRYSYKWTALSQSQKDAVKKSLPFQRTHAVEPGVGAGTWGTDMTYSHNGGGVRRSALRPPT